jgi:hypothetical protein
MKIYKKINLIFLLITNFANVFPGLPPETIVFMGDGAYIKVKDLTVADSIPVYNIPEHRLEEERIKIHGIETRKTKEVVLIEMGDDKVIVGANQKLFNLAIKKFIPAIEFGLGDMLFSPDKGALLITRVSKLKLENKIELYEISLESGNIFLILTENKTHILVHNFPIVVNFIQYIARPETLVFAVKVFSTVAVAAGLIAFSKDHPNNPLSEEEKKKAEEEKQKTDQAVEDILKDAKPGRKTKGKTKQFEKPGDFDDALKDFDKLNPKNVRDESDGEKIVKVGDLPGDKVVNVRNESKDERPTLDICDGKKHIKIRYGSK